MKGYKYRSVDYFDSNLNLLINNQIKASLYGELNDPFEASCNDELTKVVTLLESIFGVSSKETIEVIENIKSFKPNLGIYSLSLTYSDELLWAHYASSHKGFCIEYHIEELKKDYLISTTVNEVKTEYKSSPQKLTINDVKNKIKILTKLFATKSLKWEYEKEVRLIFDTNGLKNYRQSALTGIYFGAEMSYLSKALLIKSLEDRNVKFYQMQRIPNSYKLKRELVHENTRYLINILDEKSYTILKTKHNLVVENFYVLYKSSKVDDLSLKCFLKNFRNYYATIDSNIQLFDDKSVLHLINKNTLQGQDYIKFADHFIAMSTFDAPNDFIRYPYHDHLYLKYVGENPKKEYI